MSEQTHDHFGILRRILWPVYSHEIKKLLPMLLIFFLITFDYNILRTMKDALIVTAKSSGAEVIPFIKVWVMFPAALFLTFLYARFTNHLNREKVFYAMMSVFMGYFFIFITILYPFKEHIHLDSIANYLQLHLPEGCRGLIAMVRYWSFTSFYVMSELWGTMLLFTLFWGFANEVTRVEEAKRFYGLFGIGANISGFAVGLIGQGVIRMAPSINLPFEVGNDERVLFLMVGLVLICGLIVMALFRWMHTQVLCDPKYYGEGTVCEKKRKKITLSLRESFTYILRSPYLMSIAVIVVAYNIVINLLEVIWKAKVKELYPTMEAYSHYMYEVTWVMGLTATFIAIFISGNSIRKMGWTFTALLTPAVLLATSVGFFLFFFYGDHMADFTLSVLQMTPLAIVVFLGTTQNILSRACKYTVFDSTKELAFVPLSSECKLKGKAAIDGVCSRMGKSAGSVIHQGLLISFGTITASAPYVAGCLMVAILVWAFAVRVLGERFALLTNRPSSVTEEEILEKPATIMSGSERLEEQRVV